MTPQAQRKNKAPTAFNKKQSLAEREFERGYFKKAEPLFMDIVLREPTNTDAAYKYATCLRKNCKQGEALAIISQAIALSPASEAYAEQGHIYVEIGMPEDARKSFEAAITLDKNNHDAWAGLALYFADQDKREHALLIMNRAKEIAQQTNSGKIDIYHHYMSHLFKGLTLKKFEPAYKALVLDGLNTKFVSHDDYNKAWDGLLRSDPVLLPLLDSLLERSFEEFKKEIDNNLGSALFTDPFFYTGIKKLNVIEPRLENICRNFRRYFLNAITEGSFQNSHRDLLFAMADQCFFTEYVFSFTEEEEKQVEAIINEIQSTPLEDIENLPLKLAITGCYRPLISLENARDIRSHILKALKDDALLQDLVKTQIAEPLEELRIKQNIKSVGSFDDEVSRKVQEQYEENPYPRWKSSARVTGGDHGAFSKSPVHDFPCKTLLSAGCGTGKQITINRTIFPTAHITAIDISKTSIAYAQRKCRELGYNDVDFFHIDILELEKLGKTFDCISCGGVLHHMEDPFKGWQSLTNSLNPGGYMHIGLYSDAARQHVVKARELIAEKGYDTTPEGIRQCREYIKSLPPEDPLFKVTKSGDFYSISGTRDLIFHVQEHRYTIQEIRETLERLCLKFTRMMFVSHTPHQQYKKDYPNDRFAESIENLEEFEKNHPNAFAGMYQFWVHKPAK